MARSAVGSTGSRSHLAYRELLLALAQERRAGDLYLARGQPESHVREVPDGLPLLYYHMAGCMELALVAEGEAWVATPSEVFRMTPRKLLVMERGVYHAQLPAASARRHRLLWVHLNQTSGGLVDSVYSSPTKAGFTYQLIELPGRTNVEAVGMTIASELAGREWGHMAAVAGLLRYLSCVLVRRLPRARMAERHSREASFGGDSHVWGVLEAALEHCQVHFRDGVTRDEVAAAVGYSPRRLTELMATYLGHSVSDHLLNLRMVEARRLLETSDLPIREIASAVGYADPAHFTRAFKRTAGLSPRTYRRRLGGL